MNHILKLEINWKLEKVCTLVDSIQRIIPLTACRHLVGLAHTRQLGISWQHMYSIFR